MKRYILLFFTLIVAASLLIIPAAAAQVQFSGEIVNGVGSVMAEPYDGPATITLIFDDSQIVQFTFDVMSEYDSDIMCPDDSEFGVYMVRFGPVDGGFDITLCDETLSPAEIDCSFTLTFGAASDPPVKGESPELAVSVFDVFTGVGSWLVTSLGSVSGLFWDAAAGELTIIGVLAISALGIGLMLGLVLIISRWLRFRG